MTTSGRGIEFIKQAEGFSPRLFDDNGHPCIGYGCDLSEEEAAAYEGRTIDAVEGTFLLTERLKPIEDAITHLVHQYLTQNQFDALVDFCYNLGIGAFSGSTLLKVLNNGYVNHAADEFLRWDMSAGKHSKGLQMRRQKERALFMSEDDASGSTI